MNHLSLQRLYLHFSREDVNVFKSGVLRPIAFQVGPEPHWDLAPAQPPQPECSVSSIFSIDINTARLDTLDDDTLNVITQCLVPIANPDIEFLTVKDNTLRHVKSLAGVSHRFRKACLPLIYNEVKWYWSDTGIEYNRFPPMSAWKYIKCVSSSDSITFLESQLFGKNVFPSNSRAPT